MGGVQVPVLAGLLRAIASYGRYAVLAFLLTEVAVFLADKLRSGPRTAKAKG